MGQTVTVHTTPDGLITKAAGSYEVTLTGLKTATSVTDQSDGYTAKADAGKVIGCLSLKVKNTGTVASELYPFTDPQWQGASGQVAGSELASGVSCSSIGVAGDDLSGAPDPGPGQFATGSDAVEFPTGGGQLVFVDRSGAQLFKVAVPG